METFPPASDSDPRGRQESRPGADSRSVLVVEDEPVTRLVLCKILEEAGFSVVEAEDGLEALERFRTDGDGILAVVLDVVMPRLGGEKTLSELRRLQPRLPIMVVSGLEAREVERRFPDCGSLCFLRKPVVPARLVQTLKDLLAAAVPSVSM